MTDTTPDDAGWYLDEYDGPKFWEHVSMRGGTEYLNDPLARLGKDAGECWTWSGWESKGYGRINMFGKPVGAHIIGFLEYGGKIPKGYNIDHLCRNHACVRYNHLEPVTQTENVNRGLRGRTHRTHCPSNHEFTVENTIIANKAGGKTVRVCRTCQKAYQHKRYLRLKAA